MSSALPYGYDAYDDFNNEQAWAEAEAYERDRAAGKTIEPPGPVIIDP